MGIELSGQRRGLLRPREPEPEARHAQTVKAYLAVIVKGRDEVTEALFLAVGVAEWRYLSDEGAGGDRGDMLLRGMARAVWRQDHLLARRACAKGGSLEAEAKVAQTQGKRGRRRRRALQRMSQLWASRARRLVLVGVCRWPGDVEGDEREVVKLVVTARQVAFEVLRALGPGARGRIKRHGGALVVAARPELALHGPRTPVSRRARNTALGPDGLRDAAWAQARCAALQAVGQLPWGASRRLGSSSGFR